MIEETEAAIRDDERAKVRAETLREVGEWLNKKPKSGNSWCVWHRDVYQDEVDKFQSGQMPGEKHD